MAEKIGARIELDGEKEFKQAVSDCNNSLKTLKSEMNLVNAESEGQANTLEALRKKHEVLSKILDTQKQKEEEIRKSLQHAEESYNKVGNELDKYKRELNIAQTELDSMRNSSEASTKEIQEQEKAVKTLSSVVEKGETTYQRAGNRVQEWQKQLNNAQAQTIKANKELNTNAAYMKEAEGATNKCATSIDSFGKEIKKAQPITQGFGETIQQNLVNSLTDLAKSAVSNAVTSVTDLEDAQRQLQASTGATASEMRQYNSVMEDIYTSNYGESFDDVANATGIIVQTLGHMDASELKETAESAITLRDTFDMDYQEQLRAVKSLMDNFGISGKQAYNLIVQGAQQGLNKNGDLLDTINEYSVHYSRMGVSATGFFNSLVNGTKAGTFSVDKLGDAYKEFGIRVQDMASSTTEGFELLGLNADEMRKQFAAGGESAENATERVLDALYDLDDMVVQNQVGVDLFGTMWEDLGADGVRALMDVNGEISETKNAMEQVKEIKYDSLTNQYAELGRTFQSEVITPVLKEFLPYAESGIEFLSDHLSTLKPVIMGVSAGVIAYTAATKGAAVVQKAFNLELNANPIILIVSAVTAAGVAIASFAKETKKATAEEEAFNEYTQKVIDGAHEVAEATDEMIESYQDTSREIVAQNEYMNILSERITNLTDKQSLNNEEQEVLQGYIAELNTLVPDLNLAYDEQAGSLNMTNEELTSYLENSQKQIEMEAAKEYALEIAKQKVDLSIEQIKLENELADAEAKRTEIEEQYTDMADEKHRVWKQNTGEQYEQYENLSQRVDEYTTYLDENRAKQEELLAQESAQKEYFESMGIAYGDVTTAAQENTEAIEDNAQALSDTAEAQEEAAVALSDYEQSLVDSYTNMQETISEVLQNQMNMFEEFDGGVEISSEKLLNNMQSQIDGVANWADNLSSLADRGINQNLLTYLQELGPKGASYVQTFAQMSDDELKKASDMWQESLDIKEGTQKSVSDMLDTYTNTLNGGKEKVSAKMKEVGADSIKGMVQALTDGQKKVETAGAEMAGGLLSSAKKELKSQSSTSRATEEIGIQSVKGLVKGIDGQKESVQQASGEMANTLLTNTQKGLDSKKFMTVGESLSQGVQKGISSQQRSLDNTVQQMTKDVQTTVTKDLRQSNFYAAGKGVSAGLATGIKTGKPQATAAASDLAIATHQRAASLGSLYSAGQNLSYGLASGIRSGQSAVINSVASMCQAAINEARARLKIHSPSRVFAEIGEYTAQGFGMGYEEEIQSINRMIADSMDYSNLSPKSGGRSKIDEGSFDQHITIELPIYMDKQYSRTEIVEIALDGISRKQVNMQAAKGASLYV